jgi:hypothetical protein
VNSPALDSPSPPSSRPLRREVLIILVALACGVAVLPPIIFLVGSKTLGAYAGGDIRGFMENFFKGLAQGGFAFWAVALAPYVLTVLLRLLIQLVRRG